MFTKVPAGEVTSAHVDAVYRGWQLHENGFTELDRHLAGKCLPKPYRLVREPNERGQRRRTVGTVVCRGKMTGLRMVAWLPHWAFKVVKDCGQALGSPYASMRVGVLVRELIAPPGVLRLQGGEL